MSELNIGVYAENLELETKVNNPTRLYAANVLFNTNGILRTRVIDQKNATSRKL